MQGKVIPKRKKHWLCTQTSSETSNYSGAARRHQLQHKETSKAPLQCGMCREREGRQPHGVWPAHVLRCYANVEGNFRAFPTLTWEDQRLVLNSLLLPWFKASSDTKTHLEMITFMIKYLHRAVITLPFLHKAKLLYFHLRPQFLFIVSTSFKDRDSKLEYPIYAENGSRHLMPRLWDVIHTLLPALG